MIAEAKGRPNAISTDRLETELERELSRHFGAHRRIRSLTRRPSENRTSFALDEVDVVTDESETLQLIVKDLSESGLTDLARSAKPAFLANPRREIEMYQHVLARTKLETPICYGASIDPIAGIFWLFIERVRGVELFQVGDRSVWRNVTRWLARFHAHFAGDAAQFGAKSAAPLISYNRNFYRVWPQRALAFAEKRPTAVRRQIAWLVERFEPVIERLTTLPTTVIHGEFYPSNILIERFQDRIRVCPIDWELAAIGPGLIDLAALTAGAWSDEERRGFAQAYHETTTLASERPQTFEELLTDLTYCRLHLATQWLGWAEDWSPPKEHAHDWLSEAMQLAEDLRL